MIFVPQKWAWLQYSTACLRKNYRMKQRWLHDGNLLDGVAPALPRDRGPVNPQQYANPTATVGPSGSDLWSPPAGDRERISKRKVCRGRLATAPFGALLFGEIRIRVQPARRPRVGQVPLHVRRARPAGTSGGEHVRRARQAGTSGGHVRRARPGCTEREDAKDV